MKITMKTSKTMKEFFDDFIIAKKAQGLADKTIKTYQSQIGAVSNHLDVNVPIEDITKSDLEKMVTSMRNSNLAANSISTYVRILRVFLSWCNEENITNLNIDALARCVLPKIQAYFEREEGKKEFERWKLNQ